MRLEQYQPDNGLRMDMELVLAICEDHGIAITIRPDGSITGLPGELARLRYQYQRYEL